MGIWSAEQLAAEHLLEADASMWGVVLAGGIGSRFWPLSSSARPKQLLRLLSDEPLIRECIGRLNPLIPVDRVLVVTSADIAPAIRAALPELPPQNLLVEPRPLGTAAAVALALQTVMDRAGPDTLLCTIHADIAAAFHDAFRHSVRLAGGLAARDDVAVAIGCKPVRVDPGFGHVLPGAALHPDFGLDQGGPAWVRQFIEKPAAEQAAALVRQGALWHSGIFLCRCRVLLAALQERTPEVSGALPLLDRGQPDAFFSATTPVSIERGLLERLRDLVVLPGDFGWDDIGTWASLRRSRELDDDGNGARGEVHFVDASGNIVHAEAGRVVLHGVDNLLVVTLHGVTFVTTVDRATDLRPLLDQLPESVRKGTSQTEN